MKGKVSQGKQLEVALGNYAENKATRDRSLNPSADRQKSGVAGFEVFPYLGHDHRRVGRCLDVSRQAEAAVRVEGHFFCKCMHTSQHIRRLRWFISKQHCLEMSQRACSRATKTIVFFGKNAATHAAES